MFKYYFQIITLVGYIAILILLIGNSHVNAQAVNTNTPIVNVVFENDKIIATATDDNLNQESWQALHPIEIGQHSNASDLDCTQPQFIFLYGAPGYDNRIQNILSADTTILYCFKVSDYDNNTGYGSYLYQPDNKMTEESNDNQNVDNNPTTTPEEIDTVDVNHQSSDPQVEIDTVDVNRQSSDPQVESTSANLTILIKQTEKVIRAYLVDDNNQTYDVHQWYVTTITADQDCSLSGDNLFNRRHVVFESNILTGLSSKNNNQIYCFKAEIMDDQTIISYYKSFTVSGISPEEDAIIPDSADTNLDAQSVTDNDHNSQEASAQPISDNGQLDNSKSSQEDVQSASDTKEPAEGDDPTGWIIISIIIILTFWGFFRLRKTRSSNRMPK